MELTLVGSKATIIKKKKRKTDLITFTHKEERKEHTNENTLYSY